MAGHFWVSRAATQGRKDSTHMNAHGRVPTRLNSGTLSFEFHVVIVRHKILFFFSSFAALQKYKN